LPEDNELTIETIPVWKQVTPELRAELIAFWTRHQAFGDAERSGRADQAVCIGRDEHGDICCVGTAFLMVLPRLQQPMYYHRQFFAESQRGQKQTAPFFNRCREILEAYNASLPAPESIGVLVELESDLLAKYYNRAHIPHVNSTFIGYSPRGLQLRVSYFEDAVLFPPIPRSVPARMVEGGSKASSQQGERRLRNPIAKKD
jgi:hypothetical protein